MSHLLLVDSDTSLRGPLTAALKSIGHRVTLIPDPNGLTAALAIYAPDDVVLALSNGNSEPVIQACERLRSWNSLPVIMLADAVDEALKIRALDAGADDVVQRDTSVNELMARFRAIHRRGVSRTNGRPTVYRVGDLVIDLDNRSVLRSGQELNLTRKEYALLKVLALAQGRLVTYETLLKEVWGRDGNEERACVRTLVKQLRRKLGQDLNESTYLLTHPGLGYRLNVPA